MACKSLTKYAKDCSRGVSGGVSKLWLITYSDLVNIEDSIEKYEVDETGNMVTEIGVGANKFVSVGLLKNTFGLTENGTKTAETNSFEITTEMSLVISNISSASRTFVNDLIDAGEVVALIKLRSGKYVITGLDGYLEVSAVTGGTGVAGADLNGYTITLSGVENNLTRLVDPTIIPTIISE